MKYLTQSRLYPDGMPAVGLLFLRIFTGYAMAQHGLVKLAHPFNWMGLTDPPLLMQLSLLLATIAEFFGGIALIFGFFTPLACFGIMSTMFVATLTNLSKGEPIIAPMGGDSSAESAFIFVIALCLFLTGPGVLSFDYAVFGRKKSVAPVT